MVSCIDSSIVAGGNGIHGKGARGSIITTAAVQPLPNHSTHRTANTHGASILPGANSFLQPRDTQLVSDVLGEGGAREFQHKGTRPAASAHQLSAPRYWTPAVPPAA